MKWVWAVVAGTLLAAGLVYWQGKESRARKPPAPDKAGRVEQPLYRWRDAQGVLHVSDQPPKGQAAERVRLREDQNVVPMTGPAPEPEPSD